MQISGAPAQIVLPWANGDATKTNPIPVPSQQGITPGAASWTDGFPPLCATPVSSGGLPPTKADMNGGLYQMSAIDVWACAGGGFPYSSAFSTAIGGYPKGARVLNAAGDGYWISTVDNNTTDPDTGGAGWLFFAPVSLTTSGSGPASLSSAGVLNIPTPSYQKQVFTSSGVFTIPSGITSVRWTIIGGGGAGGGGTSSNGGSGGGAGATARVLGSGYTPGDTITVTVGAGGSGPTASGSNGNAGVASSIASGTQTITTVTAGGGAGGVNGSSATLSASAGGTVTNGDADSTPGGEGNTGSSAGDAGGMGGASSMGGGGGATVSGNGDNGSAVGSGGAGGGRGTYTGGSGASGIVIAEWIA